MLSVGDPGDTNDVSGYENKPSWDVAVRFQDLKRFAHIPDKEKKLLKKRAIQGVLDRAHALLGAVIKPEQKKIIDYKTFIDSGQKGELEIIETLDELFSKGISNDVLRFGARVEKNNQIALIMDASLSMTGEKIALLAVAAAVVALCVPSEKLALMGFDSKVSWIKKFDQSMSIETIVEKVLDIPAGGFSNLAKALLEMSKMIEGSKYPRPNVILISDGKYTEGADPSYLSKRYKSLNVLKIGRDQAGRELLLELSSGGNGRFFEAKKIGDLPKTMYSAMRALLR